MEHRFGTGPRGHLEEAGNMAREAVTWMAWRGIVSKRIACGLLGGRKCSREFVEFGRLVSRHSIINSIFFEL